MSALCWPYVQPMMPQVAPMMAPHMVHQLMAPPPQLQAQMKQQMMPAQVPVKMAPVQPVPEATSESGGVPVPAGDVNTSGGAAASVEKTENKTEQAPETEPEEKFQGGKGVEIAYYAGRQVHLHERELQCSSLLGHIFPYYFDSSP